MKKAVVYMLTAIVVTGSCIAPTVAYATEPDKPVVSEEKTEENTPVVVTEAPKEEIKDVTVTPTETPKEEDTSTEEETKPNKGENSDKTDKPSQEETKPQEEQKPDKDEKPEEEKKELEKLPLTNNISAVKEYVSSLTKLFNTSFFIKKDLVVIGYNYEGLEASDGFILPECFESGYSTVYLLIYSK